MAKSPPFGWVANLGFALKTKFGQKSAQPDRTFGRLGNTKWVPRQDIRVFELIDFVGLARIGLALASAGPFSYGLASPHCHQPLGVLLELLRPFGDGLCFACGFNVAQPHGLGAENQDGPAEEWFGLRCHGGARVLHPARFPARAGARAPTRQKHALMMQRHVAVSALLPRHQLIGSTL